MPDPVPPARSDPAVEDGPVTPPGGPAPPALREVEPSTLFGLPPMRYQSEYVWLIFVSSMDIMLTWKILERGGSEVNPVAREVIDMWGLPGAIAFKFALMLFVIIACEWVGRRKDRLGRRLARFAVAVSASPVAYSILLLFIHTYQIPI